MAQNGHISFLESVEVFADTMGDRFTDKNSDNCMIIIARDKDQTLEVMFGNDPDVVLDAVSTALYQSAGLTEVVAQALGLVAMARVNNIKPVED